MLVEIKEDVFVKSNFPGLNYLLQLCFYKNRYSVMVDFTRIKKTESFKQLSQIDQDALQQQFNDAIQRVEQDPQVKISEGIKRYFNIDEAIRYLGQPVSIILENSLNDGYFIEAIIKYFGQGTKIKEHLSNGWLQFENAGGCGNVGNLLEAKMQSYNALPKDNHEYLRCYVIVDSDKKYPAEARKHDYNLLINKYSPMNINIHVLEKRSMENYLPLEAFANLTKHTSQTFIDAYINMTPSQIDFYNVQHGFENKNREELPVEVANHYSTVSDPNFSILTKGSGIGNFKSDFPKFMTNFGVHRESLLKRTEHQEDPNELQNIIKTINELI